jgi:hypothetical protein
VYRPASMIRRGAAAIVLAASALIALPAPGTAAVVGLPTSKLDNTSFGRVCTSSSCTYVNAALTDGKIQAPISGRITRWRAYVGTAFGNGDPAPVKLQVLRRTVDEPGTAADQFQAIRETATREAAPLAAVQGFRAKLRIREGDFIGLAALEDDVEVFGRQGKPDNLVAQFIPTLILGDPALIPDTTLPDQRIHFNATIK